MSGYHTHVVMKTTNQSRARDLLKIGRVLSLGFIWGVSTIQRRLGLVDTGLIKMKLSQLVGFDGRRKPFGNVLKRVFNLD